MPLKVRKVYNLILHSPPPTPTPDSPYVSPSQESLGLLDFPVPSNQSPLIAKVGSEEDKQAALQASREAITLLKNADMPKRNDEDTGGQALPLDRSKMSKILLVGPACHSLSLQSGGWTKHWQVGQDGSVVVGAVCGTVKWRS